MKINVPILNGRLPNVQSFSRAPLLHFSSLSSWARRLWREPTLSRIRFGVSIHRSSVRGNWIRRWICSRFNGWDANHAGNCGNDLLGESQMVGHVWGRSASCHCKYPRLVVQYCNSNSCKLLSKMSSCILHSCAIFRQKISFFLKSSCTCALKDSSLRKGTQSLNLISWKEEKRTFQRTLTF